MTVTSPSTQAAVAEAFERRRAPVQGVSDAATLMGVSARRGFDGVYAHQVDVLGRPEDIALGVSRVSSEGACAANYNFGQYAKQRLSLEVLQ